MQNELGEGQGKWMMILQEFDLEIQTMKLVRGQGLSKMIANNQIKDEKKFWFNGETKVEDQKKIVVSQVDIDQSIIKNADLNYSNLDK